jgi:spermidine/putrescine transport system ATP-binding protein
MSDRIAVMSKGKALQIGSPVEIYERPNCRFVADFIGETNFLFGHVVSLKGDQEASVYVDQLDNEVVGLRQCELSTGQEVVLSVRPEKIRLADQAALQINCFKAKIVTMAYIGSDTRVIADLGNGLRINVWEQNKISTLEPSAYYSEGQERWAVLFPENTLILPRE